MCIQQNSLFLARCSFWWGQERGPISFLETWDPGNIYLYSGHIVSSWYMAWHREDRNTGHSMLESTRNNQEQWIDGRSRAHFSKVGRKGICCFSLGVWKAVAATLTMINKLEEVVKQAGRGKWLANLVGKIKHDVDAKKKIISTLQEGEKDYTHTHTYI